jgi:hypothetical protein
LQHYAELEPHFIAKFFNLLGDKWGVWNEDGDLHILQFNKNLLNPLITKGMTEFKEFYNIPDNVEVILSYYGNHIFKLQTYNLIDISTPIPSFHSRSTDTSKTILFEFTLPPNSHKEDELVCISHNLFLIILSFNTIFNLT